MASRIGVQSAVPKCAAFVESIPIYGLWHDLLTSAEQTKRRMSISWLTAADSQPAVAAVAADIWRHLIVMVTSYLTSPPRKEWALQRHPSLRHECSNDKIETILQFAPICNVYSRSISLDLTCACVFTGWGNRSSYQSINQSIKYLSCQCYRSMWWYNLYAEWLPVCMDIKLRLLGYYYLLCCCYCVQHYYYYYYYLILCYHCGE